MLDARYTHGSYAAYQYGKCHCKACCDGFIKFVKKWGSHELYTPTKCSVCEKETFIVSGLNGACPSCLRVMLDEAANTKNGSNQKQEEPQ